MVIQELERQVQSSTRMKSSSGITFGSSRLEDGVRQEDLGLF